MRKRYGMWGVVILSPIILSIPLGALLGNKYFRRDQIWFVQKDRYSSGELYSLDEYSVRKDSSFDKDYLLGKYGGVTVVNTYEPKSAKN